MQLPPNPAIHLCLSPNFDAFGASSLSVKLRIQCPSVPADQPMFIFNTFTDNVPSPPFHEQDIRAHDDEGMLPVTFRDIPPQSRNTQQHWLMGRETKGDVILEFDVNPREVNYKTPVGTRIDLRRDQGGLQGVGRWFLPRLISKDIYSNVVQWCLPSDAPDGTRCIWSFGEGPKPIVRVGLADTIWDSVYMVGPVQSYPSVTPKEHLGSAACYWFGSLPGNLDRLKGYNTKLFPKMMDHFKVRDESYCVFIRKAPIGFGGTGFLSSYVLEYDATTDEASDDSLIRLFSHEMVHSFSRMDSEEDGYDNAWFTEGIAELYSAVLPYRFGLCGQDYLTNSINDDTQAYFTSPRINMNMRDAAAEFFSDWYAVWIAYKRGSAYLMLIDCYLRKAVGNFDLMCNSPLDDIVVDMARRTKKGEKIRGKEWAEYLRSYLSAGDFPVDEHLQGMLCGKTLDFTGVFLGNPEKPFVPCDMGILEFGFDRNSLRTWIIADVIEGSAAARAGLRDGAEIIEASNHNACTQEAKMTYRLTVRLEGREEKIEYLPRSQKTATCWQLEA